MYPGIVVRQQALQHVSASGFRDLVASDRLRRLFRGIYLDTQAQFKTDALVRRAALAYADRNIADSRAPAFLCCESAGAEWTLACCRPAPVTVSVPRPRSVRPHAGLVIHRHKCTDIVTNRDGVRLVPLARALVQSFGRLPPEGGREMVLRAVQDGMTHVAAVRPHISHNQPKRGELIDLLSLAGDGSHSVLEIAAVEGVIGRFGLSSVFEQQYAVGLAGRGVVMDFATAQFKVNLETDGSRYHSSPEARRRDSARDLELRRDGWYVVRALYEQVIDHPEQIATALMSILVERGWTGRPDTNEGRLALASLTS